MVARREAIATGQTHAYTVLLHRNGPRRLFLAALSFSSVQPVLAADNGTFHLDTEIGTSFSHGEHHEIVYRSDSNSDVMSLLVWPLPQSIGMWLEAKAAWPGPLETSLRLKADFPLDEGI